MEPVPLSEYELLAMELSTVEQTLVKNVVPDMGALGSAKACSSVSSEIVAELRADLTLIKATAAISMTSKNTLFFNYQLLSLSLSSNEIFTSCRCYLFNMLNFM